MILTVSTQAIINKGRYLPIVSAREVSEGKLAQGNDARQWPAGVGTGGRNKGAWEQVAGM